MPPASSAIGFFPLCLENYRIQSYESILALIQELEGDVRELERLRERNRTAWSRIKAGADDPVDSCGLGFTIQRLYGVLENYFLRVSKQF